MNKETIENFVNEWFSDEDNQSLKSTPSIQSTKRLTEKEIDEAFDEIKRIYEQSLEKAHKSGRNI